MPSTEYKEKDFRAIPINLIAWFKDDAYGGVYPDRCSTPILTMETQYDPNEEGGYPSYYIRVEHIFNLTIVPGDDEDNFLGLFPPHFTEEDVLREMKRWPKLYSSKLRPPND